MLKRILFWLLLSAASPAFAAPANILVMGDSLSAAHGLEAGQGWASLLQQRLAAQGYDYTVINASISGETTAGGLTRLPQALGQHKPAIVILELGANDGLRGLPLKLMQQNLGRMITLSSKAGAKVLLVGMLLPPNYGPQYTQAFSAVYPALASHYRLPLVPFLLDGVAQDRKLMQADGLHPKAVAEPRVLDNVWAKLAPMLAKPASKP
ncbi:MAG TPA: arylesterase [Gammaproteobacteria bacterium]|jgi:acyl-CoA thioesterase-1|nr:arylesterase [Gammaproteobacteria bacterium]